MLVTIKVEMKNVGFIGYRTYSVNSAEYKRLCKSTEYIITIVKKEAV